MKNILILLFLYVNVFAAGHAGDRAISFELPKLYNAGVKTSLQDYRGKIVLLNLWASWCGGCQEEMPLFVKLQNEFRGSDFHIILSSIDKDPKNAISFLNAIDSNRVLTALYDTSKTLPRAYKCIGMPSSYLIGRDGKIVKVYVGSFDKDGISKLENKIKSLLRK